MIKKILPFLLSIILIFLPSCGKNSEKIKLLEAEASQAFARKDLNRAEQLFNQIVEIENSVSTLVMLGKIHYYKKDFSKAEEYFQKASKEDNCNSIASYWLSKVNSLDVDSRDEAKKKLVEIATRIPNRWEVEYTLGTILESEGNVSDALSLYNQAASESAKLSLVYLKLGTVYKKAKQEKMASRYFEKARLLSEDNPDSLRFIETEIEKVK